MDQPATLEIDHLTVRFDGQIVLKDFSLRLGAGQKALLTGPSGCGKSTVLRSLLGFVVPQAGSIHIVGEPLTAESVWRLRRRIAYVGQEPDLGTGIVREILESPFRYHANIALRGNLDRVPELFDTFGLARTFLDKETGDLSGGEKQRVALISALLLDRDIFLLDEVTSALDRASKQVVADYFQSGVNATMLFVAHDPEWFPFADRVIQMQPGSMSRESV
jgi:putative ABC transport system ATP-binding protein